MLLSVRGFSCIGLVRSYVTDCHREGILDTNYRIHLELADQDVLKLEAQKRASAAVTRLSNTSRPGLYVSRSEKFECS